jgi:hypothetical protein
MTSRYGISGPKFPKMALLTFIIIGYLNIKNLQKGIIYWSTFKVNIFYQPQ